VSVEEAERQGLLVLLDNHSASDNTFTHGLWYGIDGYTEEDWVDTWRALATRYRTRRNVIGADLKNEPHGPATWGTGGATDWRRAGERAGDAVPAIAPDGLIFVEGGRGPRGTPAPRPPLVGRQPGSRASRPGSPRPSEQARLLAARVRTERVRAAVVQRAELPGPPLRPVGERIPVHRRRRDGADPHRRVRRQGHGHRHRG